MFKLRTNVYNFFWCKEANSGKRIFVEHFYVLFLLYLKNIQNSPNNKTGIPILWRGKN